MSTPAAAPQSSARTTIRFRGGTATILTRAEVQQHSAGPDAFASRCKDHRFYEIVEQTLENAFEHRYLVLADAAGEVRAIQPVFFVQQNLVEGIPALHAAVEGVRRLFPKFLTMRVLMVGCAAGEGHLGFYRAGDEEWTANALHGSLTTYARRAKASLVVLKDFSSAYRSTLRSFTAKGYARVPSMPMTRLRLQFRDFDDYLNSLSKATRKDLRRKFRKAERAQPITCEVVTDITRDVDEIYRLYLQVHERSALKFERLTKDFFLSLGQSMPDRTRFFVWRQNGRIVAFSLCLVHNRTIYDEYLGLDYGVALDLHLYFYTLRDILRWAIAEGLEWYCSSPLNYEPKLHLRCELAPLDLYVMHTQPLLNPVFRRALRFLEPTRHDPVLQRYSNAHELR